MGTAHGEHEADPGVLRGFASIGLGTLASRLSGFVREVVTAAFFGAGTSMDIFVAAFTIPNLLCRVLGESAVESAFMPLFKGIHARGEKARAWHLAAGSLRGLTIALLGVVVLGIALAPVLVRIVAHGFSGDVADAAVRMTRLMFPFGLAIGLAAFMGAILLAFGRYRVYSLAPIFLNVGIVGCVLALANRMDYMSLGVGVLVGGTLQFLVQVPFVRRLAAGDGARLFGGGAGPADPDLRKVAALTAPIVAASAVQRVGVIVDRTIASFLAPGSISSLYYSFRLVHLPYAILALAAGRAVAPVLAEHHALGRHKEFRDALLSGIRMNLVFLVPVVLLSLRLARPIVGIVYQRGAFDATDLAMTSSAFALYSVGLVGMGAVFLFVRAFAAKLNTKTPVKVSILAFVLNIVLNLLLVRTPLKHAGLALASSIAVTVHAALLYVILNRQAALYGTPIRPAQLLAVGGKVALAGAALLAAVWGVDFAAGMRLAEPVLVHRIVRVALAGGTGVGAYLCIARLVGLSEVGALLVWRRRRFGPGARG
jgi:putative peptidoglycan lipid II flippase